MNQPDLYGFPSFAPLATPMVKHLLEYHEISLANHPISTGNVQDFVKQVSEHIHVRWSDFEQLVREKRQHTHQLMVPALQIDSIAKEAYVSSGWLRETLCALMPSTGKCRQRASITAQTLSTWNNRHLLKYRAWGQLDAQNVAGVLTARQLDTTHERSWLPSALEADEPYWWCYSQQKPGNGKPSPVIPCPYPLPRDLPPSTLLWTPWVGASWDPYWQPIGSFGAIRWAGASLDQQGRVQWEISEHDLNAWNLEVNILNRDVFPHIREMVKAFAHVMLLHLAQSRLLPLHSPRFTVSTPCR